VRTSTYNKLKISKLSLLLAVFAMIFLNVALMANEPAEHGKGEAKTENHNGEDAENADHTATAAAGHDDFDGHGEGDKKFNPGEMILEHIGDAHDWHLFGDVAVPLPVILYSKDKGFDVFLSSAFEHGHKEVNGYTLLHSGKVASVDGSDFYDFSITKNVTILFSSLLLMCLIFIGVARSFAKNRGKAPKGIQAIFEPFIVFIRDDVAKASIGPKYEKFTPYLLMIFFFIWINNMMGLIPFPMPFGGNLTGNIAITVTLAVLTFIITHVSANKNYWAHIFMPPGVPKPIWIILVPIEIMGVFIKPVVLTLRLFANITAGHIIGLAFISLIFIFGEMNAGAGYGVAIFSVAFKVFMLVLELLVAFLQAYVFTLLSAIYIGTAVEEHHHEEAHH
jgi:F-type H+-transporting ATPase subunit a